MSRIFKVIVLSLFITTSSIAGSDGQNELSKSSNGAKDCFEKVNRGIFAFNQAIDGMVLKKTVRLFTIVSQNDASQNGISENG